MGEFLDAGVEGRNAVHVRQICAKPLNLQGCPDQNLAHADGVFRPFGDYVRAVLVIDLRLSYAFFRIPE